jgi:hypothetical protein
MKKTILAALIAGVITAVIITQTVSLTIPMDVSASSGFCPESKDGSQADPACVSPGSRGECNKDLAGGHKDFKCVEREITPPCPACS